MESQDLHLILHLCYTDTENTSLLVNNLNVSLLFPPDTFMVITFAGALWQALLRVFEAELLLTALCCCWTLNTVEQLLTVATRLLLFPSARQFFSSLIDGCLKYKHKEKPKTGRGPARVWTMTWKLARSKPGRGRAEMQGSSVPLGRNHVSPSGAPSHRRALRIVLTFPPPYGAPVCVCV